MAFSTDEKLILEYSIIIFGNDLQHILLAEETVELSKESLKYLRGIGDGHNLASEIADVEIMIEKIKMVKGIDFRELVEKCKHENIKEIQILVQKEIDNRSNNNKKGVGHHQ